MPRLRSRLGIVLACSKAKADGPGVMPARDRYRGRGFVRSIEAVDAYRGTGLLAEVGIISGRFGLLEEDAPIPCYEEAVPPRSGWDRWRAQHDLPDQLVSWLDQFDDVVVVLPARYLNAIGVHRWRPERGVLIAAAQLKLPSNWELIRAGSAEARKLGESSREIGAALLERTLRARARA
jgi:hypothetical protein